MPPESPPCGLVVWPGDSTVALVLESPPFIRTIAPVDTNRVLVVLLVPETPPYTSLIALAIPRSGFCSVPETPPFGFFCGAYRPASLVTAPVDTNRVLLAVVVIVAGDSSVRSTVLAPVNTDRVLIVVLAGESSALIHCSFRRVLRSIHLFAASSVEDFVVLLSMPENPPVFCHILLHRCLPVCQAYWLYLLLRLSYGVV
jgi:hypothetical protein